MNMENYRNNNNNYHFILILSFAESAAALEFVASNVPHILNFIQHVGADSITTDEILSALCGLVGDLVSAYGASILSVVEVDGIAAVLQKGRRAKSSRTKNLAVWATKEIRKLKNASGGSSAAPTTGGGASNSTLSHTATTIQASPSG
ncbi:unnamed protein product [Trichobilharzia regenti]|nr:unnamed protein product [Trichobilharzia regenti]